MHFFYYQLNIQFTRRILKMLLHKLTIVLELLTIFFKIVIALSLHHLKEIKQKLKYFNSCLGHDVDSSYAVRVYTHGFFFLANHLIGMINRQPPLWLKVCNSDAKRIMKRNENDKRCEFISTLNPIYSSFGIFFLEGVHWSRTCQSFSLEDAGDSRIKRKKHFIDLRIFHSKLRSPEMLCTRGRWHHASLRFP